MAQHIVTTSHGSRRHRWVIQLALGLVTAFVGWLLFAPARTASHRTEAPVTHRPAQTVDGARKVQMPVPPPVTTVAATPDKSSPAAVINTSSVPSQALTGEAARQKLVANGEQASLWRAFSDARHQVQPLTTNEAAMERNRGVRYFAFNPGQHLTARFLDEGVRLESGQPGHDWQATLKAASSVPPATSVEAKGSRVEYQRGELMEWYDNRPEGLEHGFTLQRRPAGAVPGDSFEIEVELQGLQAEADPDSPGDLRFVNEEGQPILAYRTLKVADAKGTQIAATMRPTPAGLAFTLHDTLASYPIHIDPIIVHLKYLEPTIDTIYRESKLSPVISLDGNTAVIGDHSAATASGSWSGRVYVFTREYEAWGFKYILAAPDSVQGGWFGFSVAIDGDTIAASSLTQNINLDSFGSAYVFVRSNNMWTLQQKIIPTNISVDSSFGWDLALSGNNLLIGSFLQIDPFGGSAYLFERSGDVWTQKAKLDGPESKVQPHFPSVALSKGTAIIRHGGDFHIFSNEAGFWRQRASLSGGLDGIDEPLVGPAAIDGNTVIVSGERSVFVFQHSFQVNGDRWVLQQKIVPSNESSQESRFGGALGVKGNIIAIGEPGYVTNNVGRVHIYVRNGSSWNRLTVLASADPKVGDFFGSAVAVTYDSVLVMNNRYDRETDKSELKPHFFELSSSYKVFHTHPAGGIFDQPPRAGIPLVRLPAGIGIDVGSASNIVQVRSDERGFYLVAKEQTIKVMLTIFADQDNNGRLDPGEEIVDNQLVSVEPFDPEGRTQTIPIQVGVVAPSIPPNHTGAAFAREIVRLDDQSGQYVSLVGGGDSPLTVVTNAAGQIISFVPDLPAGGIRVVWRVEGPQGIEWPYANYAYQVQFDPGSSPLQFARGAGLGSAGPGVILPTNTTAQVVFAAELNSDRALAKDVEYSLANGQLATTVPARLVVKFDPTPQSPRSGDERYVSLLALDHEAPEIFDTQVPDAVIGQELARPAGAVYGKVYAGTRYARFLPGGGDVYGETRQIIPVNTEANAEVWWHQEYIIPNSGDQKLTYPGQVRRYNFVWPEIPASGPLSEGVDRKALGKIVIASQQGSGAIGEEDYKDWGIYSQNDPTKEGFNPNDEHALVKPVNGGAGSAIFALRDDLGQPTTSEPYVLMHYRDPADTDASRQYRFKVFRVVAEDVELGQTFNYDGEAGRLIQPLYPLSLLRPSAPQNKGDGVSGPVFEDRNGDLWAKAAGNDGGKATNKVDWYYLNQTSFYYPPGMRSYGVGDSVPFLDHDTQNPRDVSYVVTWPANRRVLLMGESLVKAKKELPSIEGNDSVEIVYQQGQEMGNGSSVKVIDFRWERKVKLSDYDGLAGLPPGVSWRTEGAKVVFGNLPPSLARRLYYNSTENELHFGGELVKPALGQPWLLLNVITEDERTILLDPKFRGSDTRFQQALSALCDQAAMVREVPVGANEFDSLAITAGYAEAEGYVTLAFNNDKDLSPPAIPVSLAIFRVSRPLYRGVVQVIGPQSLFDEKQTLIFDGDLAGRSSQYEFEWKTASASQVPHPEDDATLPDGANPAPWSDYATGIGRNNVTLEGPGLQTLADNYFTCRYRPKNPAHPLFDQWSQWTPAQLAEGWIKRVLARLNLFEQRFDDFSDPTKSIDTRVSVISLAGPRWEGAIPFTADGAEKAGLIEAYETILRRGIDFSIDGLPALDNEDANKALRLAATRLADLYMLLGNEAYSDATDPTIAISADYTASVSTIHCFQDGPGGSTLLEEELSLLRGRDDQAAPGVSTPPVYNRLVWNFTRADGEVAYINNYGIRDHVWQDRVTGTVDASRTDGRISEADAKIDYPQGHGDAWGHYLSAIKSYYRLLHHPRFTWPGEIETINLGGVPVQVDYRYGARFAKAAAARAQAGNELVALNYRERYSEDPARQWRGYPDELTYPDGTQRGWGVVDWGVRAGQGAYLDWVVGNALLPATDTNRVGSQKIDRTSTSELRDLAASLGKIQSEVDKADRGLSPLGLVKNALPLYELSAEDVDKKTTLFEKTYERAVTVLNNALAVYTRAHGASQQLRAQSDKLSDFQDTVNQREMDFRNRLVELYGYPYANDIGSGGTYPLRYDGPDIYNYMCVDPSELTGIDARNLATETVAVRLQDYRVNQNADQDLIDADGTAHPTEKVVTFHLSTQGYGFIKPSTWLGARQAQGQLQVAHSEVLQARARLDRTLIDYDNLLNQIEGRVELLEAQQGVNAAEITIQNAALGTQERLNDAIRVSRGRQTTFRTLGRIASLYANAVAEGLPTDLIVIGGLAAGGGGDFTSAGRAAIRSMGALVDQAMSVAADAESLSELGHQQAKETVQAQTSIQLNILRNELAVRQEVKQIEGLVRQEAALRLDIYTAKESFLQTAERYKSLLAQGLRLQEERLVFRQQTAANVQQQRYKDMAFRIFRNDALEKYRAQFDLAAAWVYLAVRAYDYETNWKGDGSEPQGVRPGREFFEAIVKSRAIGEISNGQPIPAQHGGDGGLADSMARMKQNWDNLRGPLGYNQPQHETIRFSLRKEFFRIPNGSRFDADWRDTLQRHVVADVRLFPEFQRYCIPPGGNTPEPALVIPFGTTIEARLNFFGFPATGGDNAYSATVGATKIQRSGVWFANYNNSSLGLLNTPRVYLVPVGVDIMRTPKGGSVREWRVQEQVIPTPFALGSAGLASTWVPSFDTQLGSEAEIGRRFADFRAYHDSGSFDPAQLISSSRLIGRSVWNTRWLLIILGSTLFNNPEEGLERFINGTLTGQQRDGQGISDILLTFQSYAVDGI